MTRSQFIRSLSTFVAAVCLTGSALAQTGPTGPGNGPGVAPTVTPALPPGALSEQALETAIKALDPNFKTVVSKDGKSKYYTFTVVKDGWKFNMQIEPSQNALWLNAHLTGVINENSISTGALKDLLKENYKVGPKHFCLTPSADGKGVMLDLCVCVTRQITVELLNMVLDELLKSVKETYPVWGQVK